ncbi:hypothetical protein [Candidatus Thiosymbion oneisti]|uniref:hypothetical protein n=1 Tax=Candidatus Thiosymbion oneisti TaxID=589554 RepID=UPI00114D2043|nr:hypothetical protein [Candidatus Thiosymbion oneisti]
MVSYRSIRVIVLGLLLVALAIAGWPVSFWLVISGSIALFANHYKRLTVTDDYGMSLSFLAAVKYSFVNNLYKSAVGVTIGFGIIVVSQAVLKLAADYVREETVQNAETTLSAINYAIGEAFGIGPLIYSLLIIFITSIFWPYLPILKNYVRVRDWGGGVLLVLFVVTSFTFFSSIQISNLEKDWIASITDNKVERNRIISALQKDIVSTSWLEQQITNLSDDDKDYFGEIIRLSSKRSNSHALVKGIAVRTAESIPPLLEKKRRAYYVEVAQNYRTNNKAIERQLSHGRELAIEGLDLSITKLITELLPSELHPLAEVFFSTLRRIIIEVTMEKIAPLIVKDRDSAVRWVKNLKQSAGHGKESIIFTSKREEMRVVRREMLDTMRKIYGKEIANQKEMSDQEIRDLLSERYTLEEMRKIIDGGKEHLRSMSSYSGPPKPILQQLQESKYYLDVLSVDPDRKVEFVGKDKFGREMFLIDGYLKVFNKTHICPIYILPKGTLKNPAFRRDL